jgi:hypothetical protein
MTDMSSSKEPVFADYLARWSKINLVAHEQERQAREEYATDVIAWQRAEIERLQQDVARYESGRVVLTGEIESLLARIGWGTPQPQLPDLERKLAAAEKKLSAALQDREEERLVSASLQQQAEKLIELRDRDRVAREPSDVGALMARFSNLVRSGELEIMISDVDEPGDQRRLLYRCSGKTKRAEHE